MRSRLPETDGAASDFSGHQAFTGRSGMPHLNLQQGESSPPRGDRGPCKRAVVRGQPSATSSACDKDQGEGMVRALGEPGTGPGTSPPKFDTPRSSAAALRQVTGRALPATGGVVDIDRTLTRTGITSSLLLPLHPSLHQTNCSIVPDRPVDNRWRTRASSSPSLTWPFPANLISFASSVSVSLAVAVKSQQSALIHGIS